MDLQLNGKVFLVTAGSKGLGLATARQLSREGAYVSICARGKAGVDEAVKSISEETGNPVFGTVADVRSAKQIERVVDATVMQFGGLDGAVINAGGPPSGNFTDLTAEDWEQAIELTLMSAVHLAYAVVPQLKVGGGGSILSIQSFTVKHPLDNLILSNALRMAVIGMLKSMANELGPQNIRVNAILPGLTYTGRVAQLMNDRAEKNGTTPEAELTKATASIPMRRSGDVEEFGKLAAFLLSPAVAFIHGAAIPFDGGATAAPL